MPVRLSTRFASLGAFQGDLIIDWHPDPNEIANAYLRVADELENTLVPLQAAKAVAIADMQHHFDTETGPDGGKWAPLDDDYAQYKEREGYPPDILRREGSMEDTATSPEAWEVVDDTLLFNSGILPRAEDGSPYWYFHQVGTDDGERAGVAGEYRANVRFQRSEGGLVADTGGAHDSFDIGRGKALPARPFIGLSEDAQLSIIEIFDTWFDESILTFQTSAGHVQTRLPSGRFGPIVGR